MRWEMTQNKFECTNMNCTAGRYHLKVCILKATTEKALIYKCPNCKELYRVEIIEVPQDIKNVSKQEGFPLV